MKGRPEAAGSGRAAAIAAAWQVIARDGPYALTLDAVAAQAGLSKGGLLHHFPSKRALIEGLVTAYLESARSDLAAGDATHPEDALRMTRAILAQTAAGPAEGPRPELALMAVIANDLTLAAPIQDYLKQRFKRLKPSPIGFEDEAILNLALDGLWILELLGLAPLDADDRRSVLKALEAKLGQHKA